MNTRNILMAAFAVVVVAVCITKTAQASAYGWTTCAQGSYGKTRVRGYATCVQGLAVMGKFYNHIKPMTNGEIQKFVTVSGGHVWQCYHTMHSYSSTWDCFTGHPVNSEFEFISTVGALNVVAPPPRTTTTPIPCGHCGLNRVPGE